MPVASVDRSIASLLLTIDTAPTDRQGVTPRRYIAVGVPPRYFDLSSRHAPALGCWDGSTACRRIISGGCPCGVVSYFLLVRQWIDFPYASPTATIATGGTYDTAANPPGLSRRANHAAAIRGKSMRGEITQGREASAGFTLAGFFRVCYPVPSRRDSHAAPRLPKCSVLFSIT